MTMYFNSIMISGVLIAAHVVLVLCLLHKIIANNLSPIWMQILSGLFMLSILLCLWMAIPAKFNFWLAFAIFAFASASFLFLFSAVYKSLSLRFLLMIKLKSGRLPFAQIDALVTDVSFSDRATLLCKMGLAVNEVEGFKISKKGMLIANKIERVRKMFGIATRGLYQEK